MDGNVHCAGLTVSAKVARAMRMAEHFMIKRLFVNPRSVSVAVPIVARSRWSQRLVVAMVATASWRGSKAEGGSERVSRGRGVLWAAF